MKMQAKSSHHEPIYIMTLVAAVVMAGTPVLQGQDLFYDDSYAGKSYEDGLQDFVEKKSRAFIAEMDIKYEMLLQMNGAIGAELRFRDVTRTYDKEYRSLFKSLDRLSAAYGSELQQIVDVIVELEEIPHIVLPSYSRDTVVEENDDVSTEVQQRIDAERERLLNSLEDRIEVKQQQLVGRSAKNPTIADLYREWKTKQIAYYEILLTRFQIIRKSLLASGSTNERARLLEMELKNAFKSYTSQNYELARQQFNFILQDYSQSFDGLDAIVFYQAECLYALNQFDAAGRHYQQLIRDYPDSESFAASLFRLMSIAHTFGDTESFYEYFYVMKSRGESVDREVRDKSYYLAGYVDLQTGRFTDALEHLGSISEESDNHLMARYLVGLAHVSLNHYNDALEVFAELTEPRSFSDTNPQADFVRNTAFYKSGLIYYEVEDFEKAVEFFDKMEPGVPNYDKCLLGLAWTNLKLLNYGQTIANVNLLFREYLNSENIYEALVLAAHVKKIQNDNESALSDLQYVANARTVYELTEKFNTERSIILSYLYESEAMLDSIVDREDRESYKKVSQIQDHLQYLLTDFHYRVTTGNLVLEKFADERKRIINQIEELDELVAQAASAGNDDVMMKADKQRDRLIRALEEYQSDQEVENLNYYLDYPIATQEGVAKYRKRILSKLSKGIEKERALLQRSVGKIQEIKQEIARNQNPDVSPLEMDVLADDLRRLQRRTDKLNVWLADNQVEAPQTEFDLWADFSGFGMSDIAYQKIKKTDGEILSLSMNIQSINKILGNRELSAHRIALQQAEEERRLELDRIRAESEIKKRQIQTYFDESYFDTSEREKRDASAKDEKVKEKK